MNSGLGWFYQEEEEVEGEQTHQRNGRATNLEGM